MKILQFCFRVPLPANDGGAIAMYNMAKGFLDNGADLDILSYNTSKHTVNLDKEKDQVYTVERTFTFPINNEIRPIEAFFNLFRGDSYHVSRFVSQGMITFIRKVLADKNYDIIHFEGLFTSPYLAILQELFPKAKFVLRQHNIEYKIWDRMASSASGVKKLYLRLLSKRLKAYEHTVLPQFDAIIPITAVDEQYLKQIGLHHTFVSPTGVLLDQFKTIHSQEVGHSVGFIGSLDWMPNQEGVKWFCDYVWPLIKKKYPSAVLNIAGKNPSSEMLALHQPSEDINMVGEVENAVSFMKQQEVLVVPLLSGSGMRIKIIEAMAAKRAIVSTSIGAEGINVQDTCLLADEALEFSQKVVELLNNNLLRKELGKRSFELAKNTFSNHVQVKALLEYYENLI